MSDFRSRVLEDDETLPTAVLILDDFLPLFGAICLLAIVINASSQTDLQSATVIQASGVASTTFAAVALIVVAVSSVQTKAVGRYIAGAVVVPIVVLGVAGLEFFVYYIIGVGAVAVATLAIDIAAE